MYMNFLEAKVFMHSPRPDTPARCADMTQKPTESQRTKKFNLSCYISALLCHVRNFKLQKFFISLQVGNSQTRKSD